MAFLRRNRFLTCVGGLAFVTLGLLCFCNSADAIGSDCIVPIDTPFAKVKTVKTATQLVAAFAEAPTDGTATKIIVSANTIDMKDADCGLESKARYCSQLTVSPGARIVLVGIPTSEGSKTVQIAAGAVKADEINLNDAGNAFRRVLMVDGGDKGVALFACNIDFSDGWLPDASVSPAAHASKGAAVFVGVASIDDFAGNENAKKVLVDVQFKDCSFRSNRGVYGGAFHANHPGTRARFTGCTFGQNAAKEGGGAYIVGAVAQFELSTFIENTAGAGGGACVSSGNIIAGVGLAAFVNCTFAKNVGTGDGGGAIHVKMEEEADSAPQVLVAFSSFDRNTAANGKLADIDLASTTAAGAAVYTHALADDAAVGAFEIRFEDPPAPSEQYLPGCSNKCTNSMPPGFFISESNAGVCLEGSFCPGAGVIKPCPASTPKSGWFSSSLAACYDPTIETTTTAITTIGETCDGASDPGYCATQSEQKCQKAYISKGCPVFCNSCPGPTTSSSTTTATSLTTTSVTTLTTATTTTTKTAAPVPVCGEGVLSAANCGNAIIGNSIRASCPGLCEPLTPTTTAETPTPTTQTPTSTTETPTPITTEVQTKPTLAVRSTRMTSTATPTVTSTATPTATAEEGPGGSGSGTGDGEDDDAFDGASNEKWAALVDRSSLALIIGAAAGSFVVVVGMTVLVCCCCCCRKKVVQGAHTLSPTGFVNPSFLPSEQPQEGQEEQQVQQIQQPYNGNGGFVNPHFAPGGIDVQRELERDAQRTPSPVGEQAYMETGMMGGGGDVGEVAYMDTGGTMDAEC